MYPCIWLVISQDVLTSIFKSNFSFAALTSGSEFKSGVGGLIYSSTELGEWHGLSDSKLLLHLNDEWSLCLHVLF